jgi:ligand-binding sensor protein
MITSGQVKAKMDERQNMISFIEDSNQTSSDYLSVVETLESQNNRIIKLMEQV